MGADLELISQDSTIYSKSDVLDASLKYFKGDSLAATQWIRKYALKDNQNNLLELDPSYMHKRIAKEIARIESKYNNSLDESQIYNLIDNFKYIIPGGSNMAGIGNNHQITSLSNCFVIGNKADSYGGIVKTDEEQVQLMKRRGGVGHDLTHLRPSKSKVLNSAQTSTGVVSYMQRYSNSTKEVAQGGRRGALMLSLDIKHPDAENFINSKIEQGKITDANISVKIDDEFMTALRDGKEYTQQFPVDSDNPSIKRKINPKTLWDKIVNNAHDWAEPGILFWDTIQRESVPDCYAEEGYTSISTNPCGEIPLCAYDSCRLLSLNLFNYVENPFTDKANFDFDLFNEHAHYAHRIMDDIVDLELEKIDGILKKIESDPEEEGEKLTERTLWEKIKKKTQQGRRTGIGITAEGDMLAAMNLRYGTNDATDFATEVHKNLALSVYESSVNLAKERGKFEIYDPKKEKDNPFIQRIKDAKPELYQEMVKHGRRNISLLTIAPNGTTSIEARTTSGVEPIFEVKYNRHTKIDAEDLDSRVDFIDKEGVSWQTFEVFHKQFETWLKLNNYDPKEVINYDAEKLNDLVQKSPYAKATSEDIDWVERIRMQGAIQQWIDHSISSTINLPEEATQELVSELYQTAWESGCKGTTIYRKGCKKEGILIGESGLEKKILLIQHNVKLDPRIEKKAQAIQYKVLRPQNQDSLHIGISSDLYVNDESKKAYFIPDQIFQSRVPLGHATSVSFGQSGMDRTQIFRGVDPDYAENIKRLQSPSSNESEGMGPLKIKSIEHAAGLVLEDYSLRNGIVGRDKNTNELINLVSKKDLRKVKVDSDEYKSIISQVRVASNGGELEVFGNNGKMGLFSCENCNSDKFIMEAGCHSRKCTNCGTQEGGGCD